MFARNGFANRTPAAFAEEGAAGLLPIIHEVETQNIQGGQENQHYHLTQAEHEFVQQIVASGLAVKLYEPVAAAGEILFSTAGDVMMAWGGEYVS